MIQEAGGMVPVRSSARRSSVAPEMPSGVLPSWLLSDMNMTDNSGVGMRTGGSKSMAECPGTADAMKTQHSGNFEFGS
jgi:hypothetical protein